MATPITTGSEGYLDRTIELLFQELEEMGEKPNADFMKMMEIAYRVLLLLNRRAARIDKLYAHDKEPEIRMQVEKVKGTFNRKDVLAIQCFFAGLTMIGGAATMGSIIPNVPFGAETYKNLGNGLGQVGQGGGAIGNAFAQSAESQRRVHEFDLEETKRHRSDRDESERKFSDQQRQALNDWKTAAKSANDVFRQMASAA